MIVAYLPVLGAIGFTMWANATYAYAHAGDMHSQIAMVVLALTIDMAKASFLPAASHARAAGRRLAPLLLVLLWLPAFTYSTFAGYAFLTTNRATAAQTGNAEAEVRSLLQADYTRLSGDLATAKRSPDWQATAACTRPRRQAQHVFCQRLTTTQGKLDDVSARLATQPLAEVNPEITTLSAVLGWSSTTISLAVALFPAILVELVAGLGLYVLRPAPRTASELLKPYSAAFLSPSLPLPTTQTQNPTETSPNAPRLKWKVPATS